MSYKALYRTYRPQTFEEIVGQDVIVKTLQNSIINKKIGHAYLFCGPRGTGKTSIARIFAKVLNCPNAHDAKSCNECSVCNEITSGTSPDVIEIDAASNNGVDEIRELRDKVNFLPSGTKYKVYIIDEVHMLSTAAFNALLKTLEEPPAHAIFILATTEPNKVLPTIISRCQRYDFKSLTNEEIYTRLEAVCNKEGIKYEKNALMSIAIAADGGMRDALSFLDQAISLCDDTINDFVASNITGNVDKNTLLELAKYIEEKNISKSLEKINELQNSGRDTQKIVNGLLGFYRDVLLFKANIDNNQEDNYRDFSEKIDIKKIYFYIDALNDVQSKIRGSNTPSIYLEVGIIKMIGASSEDLDYGKRIFDLEQKLENYEPSDGDSGNSIDSRKIRSLEEKYEALISTLSKIDLIKLSEKVQAIEEKNGAEISFDENAIKDLTNSINKINEDLEYLKVTQEGLRSQIDNVSTGGIDDDILSDRIEATLKKNKNQVNYAEIDAYIDRKISALEMPKNTDSDFSNDDNLDEINDKIEKLINSNEEKQKVIDQLREKISILEQRDSSPSVGLRNENVDLEERLYELERKIERLLNNSSEDESSDESLINLTNRINELEELVLSREDNDRKEVSVSIPSDIESRLSKMESNIYKIISGMLNPQPTKKNKAKVDGRQISLWSEDIVDFGKVEKPSEVVKVDFDDLDEEADNDEELLENTNEDFEAVEEEKDAISEETNVEKSLDIEKEESLDLDEETTNDSEDLEETNLFSENEEESVEETEESSESEETGSFFEELLEDYYSQTLDEKQETEESLNLFEEAKKDNELSEETQEQSNELSIEESYTIEEKLGTEELSLEENNDIVEEVKDVEIDKEDKEVERNPVADTSGQESHQPEIQQETIEHEAPQREIRDDENLTEYERYDVNVILRILNDSFSIESREDAERLKAAWGKIRELAPVDKKDTAQILSEGRITAVGNHEFILVYGNGAICNVVMSRKFKKSSLKLLYDIFESNYNYIAITEEIWEYKREEYIAFRSNGQKPVLSPITDKNLRVIIDDDDTDGDSMIKKNMGLFGNNLDIK